MGNVSNPGLNVANYDNSAGWNFQNGNVTTVGSAGPLSSSYHGTYDQAGNVSEWVETLDGNKRWIRGGSFEDNAGILANTANKRQNPDREEAVIGFRVAAGIGGNP